MNWQTIYIFISSTFNDMHAERDYLVKQVFPELRMWCAHRKLKLVDVDLRWGVSAADAQKHKRVVEVCMKNIDKCRPFFLCFMGQRRGWIPEKKDVNPDTLHTFPALDEYLGKASVTELEILHALIHPLSQNTVPVEHARFYFRDKSYLKQIKTKVHEDLFCPKRGLFSKGDAELERFKKEFSQKYPVIEYSASWNPKKSSPELSGELAKGRLDNFRVKTGSLGDDISEWLKKEITLAYPEHKEAASSFDPLDIELDRQDTQLFLAGDGYIPRPYEENALIRLINETNGTPILLLADAGCGKTSLLANIINQNKEHITLYYRFVGSTPDSFRIESLASSLANQWYRDGLLSYPDVNHSDQELAMLFPQLLTKAASKSGFTLILDGMDQLQDGFKESYIPRFLPKNCNLIFSMRRDSPNVPTTNVSIHTLGLMEEREDKIQMIKGYLNTFLKDVDDSQLEQIISMKGSSNPLYLKIVLHELRQHGSFDTLFEMLSKNYGEIPLDAFCQVIMRMNRQITQQGIPEMFTQLFFCCLAVAKTGMDGNMILRAVHNFRNSGLEDFSDSDLKDLFYSLGRELEPFFIFDGNKLIMRYDSMRRAVMKLYDSFIPAAYALNAGAFFILAMEKSNTEYMKHALDHLTNAPESFIQNALSSAEILIWIIKHMGTSTLVNTFRTLIRARNLTEYNCLFECLSASAPRLDTYPETFFTELSRYTDPEQPLIHKLLKQRDDYEKAHFVPLTQPVQTGLQTSVYTLPEERIYGFAFNDPYYIVYEDNHIQIIDRHTNELVNVLFLHNKGTYGLCKIAAGDDLLYVSYWGMGGLTDGFNFCECFTLPDLSLVSRVDAISTDLRSPYELIVLEGKLYAYFNHFLGKFGDKKEKRTQQSLFCISTNQLLFQEIFTGSCTHHVVSEHLTLYDHGSGNWMIIRINDGSVLVREQFIGEDNRLINHPLADGANYYAGRIGDMLCIYLTGHTLKPAGEKFRKIDERKTILYHVIDQGNLLECTDIPDSQNRELPYICDCSSRYLYATSRHVLNVYSKTLEPLGGITLSGYPGLIRNFNHSVVETADGKLIIFTDNGIYTYSIDSLLTVLNKDKTSGGYTKCDGLIRDGSFYVFGPKTEKYDLMTLEKTEALGEPGIIQFICPWNIHQDDDHCMMTAVNGKHYNLFHFDPNHISVTGQGTQTQRYEVENPDKNILLHAFSYTDENGKLVIGNVVADKQQVSHSFQSSNLSFYSCRLLLLEESESSHRYTWKERDLRMDIQGTDPFNAGVKSLVVDNHPYLVLPNVYQNEHQLATIVYDITMDSICCSLHSKMSNGPLRQNSVAYYESGLAITCADEERSIFYHLDLKENRLLKDSANMYMINQPIRDDYIYLRKPQEMTIFVYSLSKHKTVTRFELTHRNSFTVQQILTVENWILVKNLMSDVIEVYDFKNGEKLFDQRMEQEIADLFYDTQTKRLIALDNDRRVFIWKINN